MDYCGLVLKLHFCQQTDVTVYLTRGLIYDMSHKNYKALIFRSNYFLNCNLVIYRKYQFSTTLHNLLCYFLLNDFFQQLPVAKKSIPDLIFCEKIWHAELFLIIHISVNMKSCQFLERKMHF